jgi:hypothetical protein
LNVTFPAVWPPKFTVWTVADVETNVIADVVALPRVYVQPDDGNARATFVRPAVPSPMVNVTPAVCVRILT